MQTIWKYPLKIIQDQEIHLPEGAQFLAGQMQLDKPVLWFLIPDVGAPPTKKLVQIFGTGHGLTEGLQPRTYLTTIQSGVWVWHVFIVG